MKTATASAGFSYRFLLCAESLLVISCPPTLLYILYQDSALPYTFPPASGAHTSKIFSTSEGVSSLTQQDLDGADCRRLMLDS